MRQSPATAVWKRLKNMLPSLTHWINNTALLKLLATYWRINHKAEKIIRTLSKDPFGVFMQNTLKITFATTVWYFHKKTPIMSLRQQALLWVETKYLAGLEAAWFVVLCAQFKKINTSCCCWFSASSMLPMGEDSIIITWYNRHQMLGTWKHGTNKKKTTILFVCVCVFFCLTLLCFFLQTTRDPPVGNHQMTADSVWLNSMRLISIVNVFFKHSSSLCYHQISSIFSFHTSQSLVKHVWLLASSTGLPVREVQ